MKRHRGVVFDVDGTLYAAGPLRRAIAWRLLGRLLVGPNSMPRRIRAIQHYRRAQESLRGYTGGEVAREQLRRTAQSSGLSADWIRETVDAWMEELPLRLLPGRLRPGLGAFLDALRAAGAKLGVYSDYPAEAKLEALGIRASMEVVLHSGDPDIDVLKPHPRGFQVAAERLGLAPEEVLYIGDRPEVDAAGAAAAGMDCLIVGPHGPHPDFHSLARSLEIVLGTTGGHGGAG